MIKNISKLIDITADWNTGTLTDVVAVNDGLKLANNYALSFDGIDDYVVIPNSSNFDILGELTFKIKLNVNSFNDIMFYFDNYLNSKGNLSIIRSDGTLVFDGRNGSGTYYVLETAPGTIELNTDYDIHLVSDGTDWVIYVNGVEEARGPFGIADWTNGFDIEIGARTVSSSYFDGVIEEVEIWDIGFSQSEVQSNINATLTGTETGLVWASNVNTGSGTEIIDIVNGNNGTINGAAWINNYSPTGNRLSPTIDLSTIGSVESSTISWVETLNGETIDIETSVDGGSTWQTATNGSSIPNLISTDTTLDVRQTLSTTDTTITPRLLDLYWEVIEIINQWETKAKSTNDWQSETKPSNIGQTETKPANNWQSEVTPNNTWEV